MMDPIVKGMENLGLESSAADNTGNNGRQWRLWRFECNDWRVHIFNKPFVVIFTTIIRQCRAERITQGIPVIEESPADRWHLYLTEEVLYENMDEMLTAIEKGIENGGQFSCANLARKTYMDKMLGFGFFRDGFMPSYHDQFAGDFYRIQLFGFARDHQVLAKFDNILLNTMQLIKELPEELAKCAHGVMLRSEINPGKRLANVEEPFKDEANLSCIFKLDVWITKNSKKLDLALMAKIQAGVEQTLDVDNYKLFGYKSDRFKQAKAANPKFGFWPNRAKNDGIGCNF